MIYRVVRIIVLCLGLLYVPEVMAIEEPEYKVEKTYDRFEVRKYGAVLVAQTEISDEFDKAGNRAFRILADYIFGNNSSNTKMDMTAPVTSSEIAASERISMTAPVNLAKSGGGYAVQFMMPAKYTRDTLPKPKDERVKIVEIPGRLVAVHSYSGSWSEEKFQRELAQFKDDLRTQKIDTIGEPIFARFNSPFQLWFLRRNEIWLEINQ